MSFLALNMTIEDLYHATGVSLNTLRRIRHRVWRILERNNSSKFSTPISRLGHRGNVVESDESRFQRHGNVGRILRAGWYWGACERLTAE